MKLLSKFVLGLYLLVLGWAILLKFSLDPISVLDLQTRSLNLVPFANYTEANFGEAISNFVVFTPFGLLLGVVFETTALWRRLALIFFYSLGVETIQYTLAIGATDITDIITNTLGGYIGLALYDPAKDFLGRERSNRIITISLLVLLVLFLLLRGVLYRPVPKSPGMMPLRETRPQIQQATPS